MEAGGGAGGTGQDLDYRSVSKIMCPLEGGFASEGSGKRHQRGFNLNIQKQWAGFA